MSPDLQDTNCFVRVALVCGRFRDMDPNDAIAAVSTADGGIARLTYGDLRELLSAALDADDRLQRISTWHSRESGPGGLVGDYCTECLQKWPCDTQRMANGTYVDPDNSGTGADQ